MSSPTKPPRYTARVTFLAHKDEIERALRAGPSLRTVFAEMYDKLSTMSFPTFHRYVVRYLPDVPQVRCRHDASIARPPALLGAAAPAPVQSQPVASRPDPQPAIERPQTGIGARFQHSARPDPKDQLI